MICGFYEPYDWQLVVAISLSAILAFEIWRFINIDLPTYYEIRSRCRIERLNRG